MGTPSSLLEGMLVTRHTGEHKLISVKAAAGADVIVQVTLFLLALPICTVWTLSHGSASAGPKSAFFHFALFVFHL